MSAAHSGSIPTICYCRDHLFEHLPEGCINCPCVRFVAAVSKPWNGDEAGLVSTPSR